MTADDRDPQHNQSRSARQTPATIVDVAKVAGVSTMTVSRVVNGETNVRPATRDRVLEAIAALSYTPNLAARSLASNEQLRLGLLYSIPNAAYLTEFLVSGFEQVARSNAQLLVRKCEPQVDDIATARTMIAQGIDGFLLPPPLCDLPELLDVLRAARVTAVAIAAGQPDAGMSAVGIDDGRAAFEMTMHLVRLGHRRIGFIEGDPHHRSSARRLGGHLAAIAEAGLTEDPRLRAPGLFTYRSGLDAAEFLLQRSDPPTAIFACNDDMAAATVAVAHRLGLDVPGDLTVCGFDDTAIATTIWPELTTIRQPIADLARSGIELLVEEIRGRRSGRVARHPHLLLDFALVRRQSDAAPRRRPRGASKARR